MCPPPLYCSVPQGYLSVVQTLALPYGMVSGPEDLLGLLPNASAANVTANYVRVPLEVTTEASAVALVEASPGIFTQVQVRRNTPRALRPDQPCMRAWDDERRPGMAGVLHGSPVPPSLRTVPHNSSTDRGLTHYGSCTHCMLRCCIGHLSHPRSVAAPAATKLKWDLASCYRAQADC